MLPHIKHLQFEIFVDAGQICNGILWWALAQIFFWPLSYVYDTFVLSFAGGGRAFLVAQSVGWWWFFSVLLLPQT